MTGAGPQAAAGQEWEAGGESSGRLGARFPGRPRSQLSFLERWIWPNLAISGKHIFLIEKASLLGDATNQPRRGNCQSVASRIVPQDARQPPPKGQADLKLTCVPKTSRRLARTVQKISLWDVGRFGTFSPSLYRAPFNPFLFSKFVEDFFGSMRAWEECPFSSHVPHNSGRSRASPSRFVGGVGLVGMISSSGRENRHFR